MVRDSLKFDTAKTHLSITMKPCFPILLEGLIWTLEKKKYACKSLSWGLVDGARDALRRLVRRSQAFAHRLDS